MSGVRLSPTTLILYLLLAIGVPAGTVYATLEYVSSHPVATILAIVVYQILLLLMGFMLKVWSHLEDDLSKSVAKRTKLHLASIFDRYDAKYTTYIRHRHRSMDLKGLAVQGTYYIDVEKVFVQVSMIRQPIHAVSSDPLYVPEQLDATARLTIWDYLQDADRDTESLAIIGPPGCGKTTLLKHVALELIKSPSLRSRFRKIRILPSPNKRHKSTRRLPVLLYLRYHADEIAEDPKISLVDVISSALARTGGPPSPDGWFFRRLKQGKYLVMMDGLDEVADPEKRLMVSRWVEAQVVAFQRTQFIVTARPHGYKSNPIDPFAVAAVVPFTPEQVRHFVHNWYLANEVRRSQKDDPGVRFDATVGANDLLHRIAQSEALTDLSVNPLLLTMIATVHQYRSSLPERRVELYADILETFLGKRQKSKGLASDLTPAQKERVLQPLAFYMMTNDLRDIDATKAAEVIAPRLNLVSPEIAPEVFLNDIDEGSSILIERESGVYGFSHHTYQEYLCATHIKSERLEPYLLDHVGSGWWHETIRLYAARGDATSVIQACLAPHSLTADTLTLAAEAMREALEVRPSVREKLAEVLQEGAEHEDLEFRSAVAKALLNLRVGNLALLDENTYIDDTLVSNIEYELFVSDQLNAGSHLQPFHWPEKRLPKGSAHTPVVGVQVADAIQFCDWLSSRDAAGRRFRLPTFEEARRADQQRIGPPDRRVGFIVSDIDHRPRYRVVTPAGTNAIAPYSVLACQLSEDFARLVALTQGIGTLSFYQMLSLNSVICTFLEVVKDIIRASNDGSKRSPVERLENGINCVVSGSSVLFENVGLSPSSDAPRSFLEQCEVDQYLFMRDSAFVNDEISNQMAMLEGIINEISSLFQEENITLPGGDGTGWFLLQLAHFGVASVWSWNHGVPVERSLSRFPFLEQSRDFQLLIMDELSRKRGVEVQRNHDVVDLEMRRCSLRLASRILVMGVIADIIANNYQQKTMPLKYYTGGGEFIDQRFYLYHLVECYVQLAMLEERIRMGAGSPEGVRLVRTSARNNDSENDAY